MPQAAWRTTTTSICTAKLLVYARAMQHASGASCSTWHACTHMLHVVVVQLLLHSARGSGTRSKRCHMYGTLIVCTSSAASLDRTNQSKHRCCNCRVRSGTDVNRAVDGTCSGRHRKPPCACPCGPALDPHEWRSTTESHAVRGGRQRSACARHVTGSQRFGTHARQPRRSARVHVRMHGSRP